MTAVASLATACTDDAEFESTSADATSTAAAAGATSPPDTADDLLFVVRAPNGHLVLDTDGTGTLSMVGPDHVTWFSDRPARDAGVTTMRQALRTYGWEQNGDAVSDDAPNATLTTPELGDAALVVELLAASVDEDHVSFDVRTVSTSAARDLDLSDLDLFIDTTTSTSPDPVTAERPDPAALADAAGFDTNAPLADHVAGLLRAAAAAAGPSAADGRERTVELAVRASATLNAAGDRASVPVLLVPPRPVALDASAVAEQIQAWLATSGARVDALLFDVTIASVDPASTKPPSPVLVVQGVELPLGNVDLPT